jgi:exosortase D (VPLPA-CTERM-specific)
MSSNAPAGVSPGLMWAAAASLVALSLALMFHDGAASMLHAWGRDEYSYAYLVPPITLWLLWQRRDDLFAAEPSPSWWGVVVVACGLLLALFGEFSTIYTIVQYALILTVFGIALTLVGPRGLAVIWAPLLYLVFTVPLPGFLYNNLSAKLQLISSELGVAFIRLFSVPVFLEGNVIDLGVYQLQVVEACSGLRYLFPLLSFGYLCTLLYRGPWWHKVLLLLATLPITVVVNSVRIGITGILVNYYGIAQAEGFMHFFEGWVIFIAAVGILFALMWLLARLSGHRRGIGDVLEVDRLWPNRRTEATPTPARAPTLTSGRRRSTSWLTAAPTITAGVLLAVAAVGSVAAPARSELVPYRPASLATFPMRLGEWQGREQVMEQIYIKALKFDDYLLADYWRPDQPVPVNLYVAYYESQRKGASVHSPRSCIPGGGWEISDLRTITIPGLAPDGGDLPVNRAVIGKGKSRQLVYYWFDQRGRQMTNEYNVKVKIFWDALTRNRTDGALVRLVTTIQPYEDVDRADARLRDFLRVAYPRVSSYIPG